MKLRKWMALLLAVMMVFGMAACGNNAAQEENFSQEPDFEDVQQDETGSDDEFIIPI